MKRSPIKKGRGFAVSTAQRAKVKDARCLVCHSAPCDPAHLVGRTLDKDGDPRHVIPLCRRCHTCYDTGSLDLLPHEAGFREEMGYAVSLYGSVSTIKRVANNKGIQF